MSEHQYIGSTEMDEVELNRLRLLEGILDPATTRHLEMISVAEGWKCLEVGAVPVRWRNGFRRVSDLQGKSWLLISTRDFLDN